MFTLSVSPASFSQVPTGLSVLRPSHLIILAKYQGSNYSFTIKHFLKCVDLAPAFANVSLALLPFSAWRYTHLPALGALCAVLRNPPRPGAPAAALISEFSLRGNPWVISFLFSMQDFWASIMTASRKVGALHCETLRLGGTNGDRQETGGSKFTSPTRSAPRNTHTGQGAGASRANADPLTHQTLSLSLKKKILSVSQIT